MPYGINNLIFYKKIQFNHVINPENKSYITLGSIIIEIEIKITEPKDKGRNLSRLNSIQNNISERRKIKTIELNIFEFQHSSQVVQKLILKNIELFIKQTRENLKSNKIRKFCFKPKHSPITIGRFNCTVDLNDEYLSKNHCMIEFKENNWVLRDGFHNNFSKNGTW